MAKNKTLKKYEELLDVDFAEDLSSPNDETIAGMMAGLIETNNHQQRMAIELTKLIVENSIENMNKEK